MRKLAILSSLLAVCFVTLMQAQTAAPKPDPELKKLQVWLGHWKGVVEYQSGWWGPAHKVPVEETFEWILGGFFMQVRGTVTNPTRHILWISGYDPAKKNYPTTAYTDTGAIHSYTHTVDGNTWTLTRNEPISHDGKDYLYRATATFSADSMSRQEKAEISDDGKTWTTMFEYKGAKVKPAAKKEAASQRR